MNSFPILLNLRQISSKILLDMGQSVYSKIVTFSLC